MTVGSSTGIVDGMIRPSLPGIAAPTREALEAVGYVLTPAPVPGGRYLQEPQRTPTGAYTPVRFHGPPFLTWAQGRDPDAWYWVELRRVTLRPVSLLVCGEFYASNDRWLPLLVSGNRFPHWRVAALWTVVLDSPVKA